MECKIVKKAAFTVIGSAKIIKDCYGFKECPKFWDEHNKMKSDCAQTAESRAKNEVSLTRRMIILPVVMASLSVECMESVLIQGV